MNNFVKIAAAVGIAGVVGLGSVTQSEARNGRNAAAIGGFVAGAVVGSAIANSANGGYYNDGYYYREPGYYEPGYAYSPGYETYSYEPAPTYVAPAPRSRAYAPNCWQHTSSDASGYCGGRSTPSF